MSPTASRAARRALVRTLLTFATLLTALVGGSPARAAAPSVDARENAVIDRINAVRAQHGLAALAIDPELSRAADHHSRRMARARTLAHRVWDEGALAGRLHWATGDARVGETLFWGRGSARSAEMVRAWMRSPGHRALLLSSRFRSAGVGIRPGGGGIYATVDLASS